MSASSDQTKDLDNKAAELAKQIVEAMKASHSGVWIDPETHAEEHRQFREFLRLQRETEEKRRDRRERLLDRVVGSAVVTGLLALVGFIGKATIKYLQG